MRLRLLCALLLVLLGRGPGFADTVYLTNGRSFEGVIAEVSDAAVRIQMPGGSLSLPRSHVLRVEKSESDFAEYLKRKAVLQHNGEAGDWLKLARWAKSQGLEQGAREAALTAADLDPHVEGIAPFLRAYGYVLDAQLERWIPYADSMRRKGLVQWNGQWISREEHAARQRAQQEEAARQNAERAAFRAAQATQAAREAELALAQMELQARLSEATTAASVPYSVPLYVYPWYVPTLPTPRPCHHCGPQNPPQPPGPVHRVQQDNRNTYLHVPGSLIPGELSRSSMPSSSSQH
jgi:hypothetical protein